MQTLKQRINGLGPLDKKVATKLLEEILVALTICYKHRAPLTGIYDDIGSSVSGRVYSDITMLVGILDYESHTDVLNEITKMMNV